MLRRTTGLALPLALAGAALAQQPANAPRGAKAQPPRAAAQPQQPAQGQPQAKPQAAPATPQTHLKVGDPAPDFSLRDTEGKEVKLSDFRGKKNVVLAFYVLAFTGG